MAVVEITGPAEWVMLIVTFVSALGAAVAVINRWLVAPQERRRLNETKSIVAEATGPINDKLDQVVSEVTYNGGGSLKDAVKRTEMGLVELRARFEEHDKHHGGGGMEPGL